MPDDNVFSFVSAETENEIRFSELGCAGVITLTRPQALNALTAGMAERMRSELAAWAKNPSIHRVIIEAEGDRAFCAGGDIRNLYDWGRAGDPRALGFYNVEYHLNTDIKRFPKPYVALIDGIVMGGGVGISIHGSHRVCSEHLMFAMPETGIGLFPDVGGTYFLPRLPGEIGTYLALTGARLGPADALSCGLATHFVPRAAQTDLREAMFEPGDEDTIISRFSGAAGDAELPKLRDMIDRSFCHQSVEAIIAALEGSGGSWSEKQASILRSKSPTSLKIALRQMQDGSKLDFEDCMRVEYRIVSRVLQGTEFFEGVRATIIDKDRAPRWSPPDLHDVADAEIDRYFAALGAGHELY